MDTKIAHETSIVDIGPVKCVCMFKNVRETKQLGVGRQYDARTYLRV